MHIYSLSLGLARAYLLEQPWGLLLMDAGSPGCEQRVLRQMRALGRSDLQLIFITHAHLDHYGSAAALHRLTGATVAIHPADASALAAGKTHLGTARQRGRLLKLIFPLVERCLRPEPVQPDLPLEDGATLEAYGWNAQVVHTPGHTPGSCCLLVEKRFAFVGDLLSSTGRPHVQRYYANDWSLLPASLARLQALQPEQIYPGHGDSPLDWQTLQSLYTLASKSPDLDAYNGPTTETVSPESDLGVRL